MTNEKLEKGKKLTKEMSNLESELEELKSATPEGGSSIWGMHVSADLFEKTRLAVLAEKEAAREILEKEFADL